MSAAPARDCPLPRQVAESVWSRLDPWLSSVEPSAAPSPHEAIRFPLLNPDNLHAQTDTPEVHHRHAEHTAIRTMWRNLLPVIEPDYGVSERFRSCGTNAWVVRDSDSGAYRVQANTCKLRICPACSRRIQRIAAARVRDYLLQHPDTRWQLVTLTIRHSPDALREQLTRLVAWFRRLRQRKLWKSSVPTGYAVLEVTFHEAGSISPSGRVRDRAEWHPHLHVLAQTEYLDWSALHRDWRAITGDSTQLDCQPLRSPDHAAAYIAKYIAKAPNLALADDPQHAAQWYHALKGRRLLIPFGATSQHKPEPTEHTGTTETIGRLSDIITSAQRGSYPAQCILVRLHLRLHPPKQRGPNGNQPNLPWTEHPP